jgi:N-terminal acetyltransferase B complex catalytic subunit
VLHQAHRAVYNMSSMRAMHPMDLLKLEKVNLDPLTETYHIGFYLEYLAKWPHLCRVIVSRDDEVEAYSKLCLFSSK